MFPFFPYSNFHRMNADWTLKKVQELATAVEGIAANVATWASRIQQAETDATNAVATANNAQTLVGRAVRWDVQSLTDVQQTQARTNIGAVAPADIPDVSDVVRYSPQTLTTTEQTRARLNIGATSQADIELLLATKHYVKYDEQSLTAAQQAQARANIGAISENDLPDISDVVRYSAQARTPEQQLRARTNIGAAYSGDVTDLADRVTDVEDVASIALTYAAQTPTNAQKAQARSNIGAGSAVDVQTNSDEIQNIYGELNSLANLLTITATPTSESAGTWTGATWDAIKSDIQRGKVIPVTIPTGTIYALFNGISEATSSGQATEIATSYPVPMYSKYRTITVYANGVYTIDAL